MSGRDNKDDPGSSGSKSQPKQDTAKTKTKSDSQKGTHTFKITIPAHKSASENEEIVPFTIRWSVQATRPMSARGWTLWEITRTEQALSEGKRLMSCGQVQRAVHELSNALDHGVWAWTRTHLRGKRGSSNSEHYAALFEKAPAALRAKVSIAHARLPADGWSGERERGPLLDAIAEAVAALLDAARHPPRNRRRFPARRRGPQFHPVVRS